ncbi:hypothetical protein BGX26_003989 [Mortierella sp. AD094]|nr:hypothetical protein BGX26_003989 [Mortierella sp. AD094]
MKQNPRLEKLDLDCIDQTSYGYFSNYRFPDYGESRHECDDSILSTLKRHPSLRAISLNIRTLEANPKGLAIILKHCPTETMQKLTLIRSSDFHNTDDEQVLMSSESDVVKYQESWPTFTALREFEFKGHGYGSEDLVIIPLLQNCPNLVKLVLPWTTQPKTSQLINTIVKHCLKLEIINARSLYLSESHVFHLIQHCSRLRELYVCCLAGSGDSILRSIVRQCSSTLETLHLTHASGISSKTVARILGECPRLKWVWVHMDSNKNGITLSDLVLTPWASNQIERLDLNVLSYDPTLGEESVDIMDDQQEIVDLILQLDVKFKEQKKTRSTGFSGLSWISPEFIMNRESGLALMNNQITERRLSWLGLRWPTLKEIRDREKEEKIRQMGFIVVDPLPKWHRYYHVASDEENADNMVEEENGHVTQDIDEEYTIYKTRNRRRSKRPSGRGH